jgi:hypothetical protein
MLDIAPDSDGNVFLLTNKRYKPSDSSVKPFYVVKFDKQGNHSLVNLDTSTLSGFIPQKLALFGSGNFFVAGYITQTAKPMAFMFNDSGQIVKQLLLKKDLEVTSKKGETKQAPEDELIEQGDLSWAQSTSDGSVYLTRPGLGGPVFIISSSGQ